MLDHMKVIGHDACMGQAQLDGFPEGGPLLAQGASRAPTAAPGSRSPAPAPPHTPAARATTATRPATSASMTRTAREARASTRSSTVAGSASRSSARFSLGSTRTGHPRHHPLRGRPPSNGGDRSAHQSRFRKSPRPGEVCFALSARRQTGDLSSGSKSCLRSRAIRGCTLR